MTFSSVIRPIPSPKSVNIVLTKCKNHDRSLAKAGADYSTPWGEDFTDALTHVSESPAWQAGFVGNTGSYDMPVDVSARTPPCSIRSRRDLLLECLAVRQQRAGLCTRARIVFSGRSGIRPSMHRCSCLRFFGAWSTHDERQRHQEQSHQSENPESVDEAEYA